MCILSSKEGHGENSKRSQWSLGWFQYVSISSIPDFDDSGLFQFLMFVYFVWSLDRFFDILDICNIFFRSFRTCNERLGGARPLSSLRSCDHSLQGDSDCTPWEAIEFWSTIPKPLRSAWNAPFIWWIPRNMSWPMARWTSWMLVVLWPNVSSPRWFLETINWSSWERIPPCQWEGVNPVSCNRIESSKFVWNRMNMAIWKNASWITVARWPPDIPSRTMEPKRLRASTLNTQRGRIVAAFPSPPPATVWSRPQAGHRAHGDHSGHGMAKGTWATINWSE